jgi:class 3 adenylate cyclase
MCGPNWGFENPTRFKFCGACGTSLLGQAPVRRAAPTNTASDSYPAQTARRTPAAAEHRQLTVLFCDIVESTIFAIQPDTGELREVVQACQRVCAEVIQRYEGYIAQYLGDDLLIYFGYPQAHEDDGQRAARAALGMVDAMEQLNQYLMQERGVRLAVRLGIHTRLVVGGSQCRHLPMRSWESWKQL